MPPAVNIQVSEQCNVTRHRNAKTELTARDQNTTIIANVRQPYNVQLNSEQ